MMRAWQPQIVPRLQTPCRPWELRNYAAQHPIGAQCSTCQREVALPRELRGHDAVCLYCALDSGLLPEVEIKPEDERSLHEVALDAARGSFGGQDKGVLQDKENGCG